MFAPVAPSGWAQPMITSSTSAGSIPARDTACCTTCAPRVAPWVMLKAPRQDLHSGVRAVDTITASLIFDSCSALVETLAFSGEALEQRRRFPEARVAVGVGGETLHGRHHVVQARL